MKTTKVSAKAHKEATVGGKGQKRKKKKTTTKAGSEVTKGPRPAPADTKGASTNKSKASKKKGSLFFKSKTASRKKRVKDHKDMVATQRKMLRRVKWSAREDNMVSPRGNLKVVIFAVH